MNLRRSTLFWTAITLVILGSLHTGWRHLVHQVPLLPGSQQTFWDIEARVEMEAQGDPVRVVLALPQSQPGFLLQSEHTASPGFGISFMEGDQRRVEWTIRSAQGTQWLYYRTQFRVDPDRHIPAVDHPPTLLQVTWSPSLETAAAQILRRSWQESADAFSLARAISQRLSDSTNQNAGLLLNEMTAAEAMVRLLNEARVPARVLYGLKLEDARRRQTLQPLVQVFNGQRWQIFDPLAADSSSLDTRNDYLLWQLAAGPILEVEGARESRVTFSMLSTREPASGSIHAMVMRDALLNLSIHSLPISEQAIFKTLLLLPLGALVVVILRVLVGLKTSGTFMPVLIALAFLEMSLLPGLITFLLLVGTGLVLRQLLAHLNLLLVARVAAVIVCVIGLIALMAVVSFHAGITTGMQVTLFPMIILAWTIERMSILWEEEGPKEVMMQGMGSLITATAAFVVMDLALIRYWMFNFPGLQLVVLALILLFGSYTGYRLLELWRFSPLVQTASRSGTVSQPGKE
ncbi:UUP1 family membrane protein [Marinospirillum alkaliphilum]|uniref:Inactive transglutaminase fused to 7 transmembrane helices n=1 Tax=Marinospirillum alkaliphilum DSM 21637 TaxID=1122209 RepID=A0A1K1XP86_9GAMM|nr:UUP1 family membrane protein [Marinospirillum alkaliphilum]SFX50884.1 Inactive transglutaminase fused to 7 transmembrane helices [Marinospirillum alkaliphilum DSM 21637]